MHSPAKLYTLGWYDANPQPAPRDRARVCGSRDAPGAAAWHFRSLQELFGAWSTSTNAHARAIATLVSHHFGQQDDLVERSCTREDRRFSAQVRMRERRAEFRYGVNFAQPASEEAAREARAVSHALAMGMRHGTLRGSHLMKVLGAQRPRYRDILAVSHLDATGRDSSIR